MIIQPSPSELISRPIDPNTIRPKKNKQRGPSPLSSVEHFWEPANQTNYPLSPEENSTPRPSPEELRQYERRFIPIEISPSSQEETRFTPSPATERPTDPQISNSVLYNMWNYVESSNPLGLFASTSTSTRNEPPNSISIDTEEFEARNQEEFTDPDFSYNGQGGLPELTALDYNALLFGNPEDSYFSEDTRTPIVHHVPMSTNFF